MIGTDKQATAVDRLISGAKLAAWAGPVRTGEAGLDVVDGHLALTVFEVPAVPDFSSERFPDLSRLDEAQRVHSIANKQAQFLSALHQLGPSVGISIRYCLTWTADARRRIRILLIGRAFASTQDSALALADRVRHVVEATIPREYRIEIAPSPGVDAALDAAIELRGAVSLVEVIKSEKLVRPWHDPELCGVCLEARVPA